MNLECLNDIIKNRLAIHIDVSDNNSWDLNSGFTSISLSKWSNAKSDNINLHDFGLTAYDNGRVNDTLSKLKLTPNDNRLTLYRVGYNNSTGGTFYDLYPMSGITTGSSVGNYFELNGGYLQGFFKLQNEKYEVFPARYGEGITIENLIRIDPDSSGIFFLMGARAEDKYNPFFSGETKQITRIEREPVRTGIIGQSNFVENKFIDFSGVTTSKDNHLNAFLDNEVRKKAFSDFANATNIVEVEQPKDSTFDNIISFELTEDKKISVKKIDENGLIDIKTSPNSTNATGWTFITTTFTPNEIISDPNELKCLPRRKGTLKFFVRGRQFWKLDDFDEFYFRDFNNNSEKVLGVPYNISWGGGSFGLKHSWHYDINTYSLYSGETQNYIDNNFIVINNPLKYNPCDDSENIVTGSSGNSLVLLEDNVSFMIEDECNPTTGTPITVMETLYSGATGQSLNSYFIKVSNPIELLSNRDYEVSVDIYDDGIFQINPESVNEISLVVYSDDIDIAVLDEIVYKRPITTADLISQSLFPTNCREFEYEDAETGLLINGETGLPVINGHVVSNNNENLKGSFVSGENMWHTLKFKFETETNSGRNLFNVGLLIESNRPISENGSLFIKNFKYKGSDVLNQDSKKSNQLIEQNFNSSYKGGIQKLRIYDIAFDNASVFHNVRIEIINQENYGNSLKRGGRIIMR